MAVRVGVKMGRVTVEDGTGALEDGTGALSKMGQVTCEDGTGATLESFEDGTGKRSSRRRVFRYG
jgi:hypothetical protein